MLSGVGTSYVFFCFFVLRFCFFPDRKLGILLVFFVGFVEKEMSNKREKKKERKRDKDERKGWKKKVGERGEKMTWEFLDSNLN